MEYLNDFYERELRNMKVHCFKLIKKKKFKRLALKLSSIPITHKQALLDQYFKMCKNVYLIRREMAFYQNKG